MALPIPLRTKIISSIALLVAVGGYLLILPPQEKPQSIRVFGKASLPFSAQSSFSWIDQDKGIGRARVAVSGSSFSSSVWSYQWVLAEGSSSPEVLAGEFKVPTMNKTLVFEIEVRSLESLHNQNLIFQIKPVGRLDSSTAVVIPTHFEQTREGEIIKKQELEAAGGSLLKSFGVKRKRLPTGVQF